MTRNTAEHTEHTETERERTDAQGTTQGTAPMHVAIAGMGLIGGSIARRLVSRGMRVTAWNHRPRPYAAARAAGISCVDSLEELARAGADVLVLAVPLKAMAATLATLAGVLPASTTLTDVGSVKAQVRREVAEAGLLAQYVGGHPMAGNEKSGYAAADPALFDGALWALTFDASTDRARFDQVARMVTEGLGNTFIALDDETHDHAAALISHMPHVVSTALSNRLVADPNANIAVALAAGCWRDMTRVSLTDPGRTRAMVEEDPYVPALLRDVAARLNAVADVLERGGAEGDRMLTAFFAEADPFRAYKAPDAPAAEPGTLEAPEAGEAADDGSPAGGWRAAFLASARRGERVTAVLGGGRYAVARRALGR